MKRVSTLAERELSVYFLSPIAYVVLTIFLAISGVLFITQVFSPGAESSLRGLSNDVWPIILVFILPMITMRLLSDEFRSGTIETLMTAPVTDADVVLGKFLGAMVFYLVILATTLLYPVLLTIWGSVDWGMAFSTYVGLILLGGFFISVGLFFSAWTSNQVIAVVCSFVLLAVLMFLARYLGGFLSGLPRMLVQHVDVRYHYQDFARGAVVLNHVVYFVTLTALFLFLTIKTLESRRWR